MLVTEELINILYDILSLLENWRSEEIESASKDDDIDLQIEQVFVLQDGTIKYCPSIISPLVNYETRPREQITNQKYDEKVNKKIQSFLEDIEFILG